MEETDGDEEEESDGEDEEGVQKEEEGDEAKGEEEEEEEEGSSAKTIVPGSDEANPVKVEAEAAAEEKDRIEGMIEAVTEIPTTDAAPPPPPQPQPVKKAPGGWMILVVRWMYSMKAQT